MNSAKGSREIWSEMIQSILTNGFCFADRRERECYELLNQTYTFTPEQFSSIREPIQFLASFTEWIYPDVDEIKQIVLETDQSPHYEYSYAHRLFSYNNTVNQIDEVIIPLLEKDPYTRRAIMGFLDPKKEENKQNAETPSLISIHFLYRNQQLQLTAHIRSCDIFFGFPANLLQLHTILSYVCAKLHLNPGNISVFCTSAHIFEDQKPYINKLKLPK